MQHLSSPRGYRDPVPVLDSTLWYGPFPARWWPVFACLFAAVVLAMITLDGERNRFRSIECTRPGACVVTRGSDWTTPRVTDRIDVASLKGVEVRRSSGKNPVQVLSLVAEAYGTTYEIVRGPQALELADNLRPFFEDRTQTSLSIHLEPDVGDRGFPVALTGVALACWLYFGVVSLRRSGRFRISIVRDQDLLRVERMTGGVPRGARDATLAHVVGVRIQKGSGHTCRLVLETSEGSDFPLTEPFLGEGPGHLAMQDALREELRLT